MSTSFNPVRGMRDFGKQEMVTRNRILKTIQTVTETNGFSNIQTPVVEMKDFLSKGNEESDNSKLGFSVLADRSTSEAKMGLRYDLTVPLARYFGANKAQLTLPFRAYQTGEVYRAERPQRGRYREFTQCDIDVIGDKTFMAELDILNTAFIVFEELNINNVNVIINDKKILVRLLEQLGFSNEDMPAVLREIDKLDKISLEKMQTNLAAFCDEGTVDALLKFITDVSECSDNASKIKLVETLVEDSFLIDILNFFDDKVIFNPFLARGMDYYTDIIFEVKAVDDNLSIAAGGRYDNFKDTVPAVGLSFGFERIIPLVSVEEDNNKACVLVYDKNVNARDIFMTKQKLVNDGFNVLLQPRPKNLTNLLNKLQNSYGYFVLLQADGEVAIKEIN
jgi:histidyl-tRNA synthetase